jgi:hypothetical protein
MEINNLYNLHTNTSFAINPTKLNQGYNELYPKIHHDFPMKQIAHFSLASSIISSPPTASELAVETATLGFSSDFGC